MSLKYDFTFAEIAIQLLESGNSDYIKAISETDAAKHIVNHATYFSGYTGSAFELMSELLTTIEKESLHMIVRNIAFVREYIENKAVSVAMQFLPMETAFFGSIFFTCGYDIGVAFGENCSLNIAHPKFLSDMRELMYYAIHEIHHVGFIKCKGGAIPSLSISTRGEMADLIAYLTHMEGMATYAPYALREQNNALNNDNDYVILQNSSQLIEHMREYLDIFGHFDNARDKILSEEDWQKLGVLSDVKRLWYIIGAHMARTIDKRFGREHLLSLLYEPSKAFIAQATAE